MNNINLIIIRIISINSTGLRPEGVLDLGRHGNGKSAHLKRSACKCVGVLGYLRRGCSSVWASWASWARLLTCVGVLGLLGVVAQVCRRLGYAGRLGSNTWRSLGMSDAQLAAKATLKRGEFNLKSKEL